LLGHVAAPSSGRVAALDFSSSRWRCSFSFFASSMIFHYSVVLLIVRRGMPAQFFDPFIAKRRKLRGIAISGRT
jgi:hypothetical protein